MMTIAMRPMSIRIAESTYVRLRRQAALARTSVGDYTRMLVERALVADERRRPMADDVEVEAEVRLTGLRAALFAERALGEFLAQKEGLAQRLHREAAEEATRILRLEDAEVADDADDRRSDEGRRQGLASLHS